MTKQFLVTITSIHQVIVEAHDEDEATTVAEDYASDGTHDKFLEVDSSTYVTELTNPKILTYYD